MRLLALLLLAIAANAAAIDGVVMNGTTGKPQAGATVTLFRVGQNGPESIESVKSDAAGKFAIDKELPGPRLLQAAYDGVTYNHMLPPGQPSNNVSIAVYQSTAKPGGAHVESHFLLIEPSPDNHMSVSETFVWQNEGKTTFNDPEKGTLQFYLPAGANGQVEVNVLAPQGMPIRRAPEKTGTPDVYKVDFPIKPGQSRVDLAYQIPFSSPGDFTAKVFVKGIPTRVVAPPGVTLQGPGTLSPGPPNTNTTIYSITAPEFTVAISGTGTLHVPEATDQSGGGSQISQIMPRLYRSGDPAATLLTTMSSVKWIMFLALSILGLGFALLYRAGAGEAAAGKANSGSSRR